MFDYLESEAYRLLRYEISCIAVEVFSEDNVENTDFYNGKKSALNLILQRMNAVQTALEEAQDEETERISESEQTADNSSHEQQ